jgi:ribosomal protein S18 acetylase RimI-like enzyme
LGDPPALWFEPLGRPALEADGERALALAALAVAAAADFYAAFSAADPHFLSHVAGQIATPQFPLAEALVLRAGAEDVALVCGTAMPLLAAAQMASIADHMRHVPPGGRAGIVARVRRHSAGVEPGGDGGHYISRVAVVPGRRGAGFGRAAVAEYLSRLGSVPVHLHVRRDNAAAIALYTSLGFVGRTGENYLFPLFSRPA